MKYSFKDKFIKYKTKEGNVGTIFIIKFSDDPKKKKYIFWIIMFFITISTTGILGLGAGWDEYYKKNHYAQAEFLKHKSSKALVENTFKEDTIIKKDIRKGSCSCSCNRFESWEQHVRFFTFSSQSWINSTKSFC